tara:strand:+ start:1255 stop:2034 length:780 start_codon:yes stop_codon:yes gene_type:complete
MSTVSPDSNEGNSYMRLVDQTAGHSLVDPRNSTSNASNHWHATSSPTGDEIGCGSLNISMINTWAILRGFMRFDLSSLSGTITSAKFKFYNDTQNGLMNDGDKFYLVGGTFGGSITVADYSNITNRPSSGTYAGTSVRTYTSAVEINISAGGAPQLFEVSLTSEAITDINSAVGSGNFDVVMVSEEDYLSDFSGLLDNNIQIQGCDICGADGYTSGEACYNKGPVLELSTGYGNKVYNISAISTINGISSGGISKVNEV